MASHPRIAGSLAHGLARYAAEQAHRAVVAEASRLAAGNPQLEQAIVGQLTAVPDGNGWRFHQTGDDRVDGAELARRTRQALGLPAAAPADAIDAAAVQRQLRESELNTIKRLHAAAEQGDRLDQARVYARLIRDLEYELNPPELPPVMRAVERERAELQLAISKATGETRTHLEAKLSKLTATAEARDAAKAATEASIARMQGGK
jgi:hypothetical protein